MRLGKPNLLRDHATLVAMAVVGALAIYFASPGFHEIRTDTYRLLYSGRWIAQHGLPSHDVFTVAARGRPFADQQWLAELLNYETWKAFGYNGLGLLAAGVFGGGFALLAALMRRRGASALLAISCGAIAVFGTWSLTFIRAQVFVIPLFVLLLWLCLADSDGARPRARVVLVLPVLVLWANLHGSVLMGALLVAAYLAYRALAMARRGERRAAYGYGALAAAAALTPLATPYGTHVLVYYGDMIGNKAVALADVEWDPPAFPALPFFQFAIPPLLAIGSLAAARSKQLRAPGVLLAALALTAVAAAFAMRNNIWLDIVAAMLLAETTTAWVPTQAATRLSLGALAVVAVSLVVIRVAPIATLSPNGFQSQAPLGAIAATAAYAAAHPCARVLADETSASALLWLEPGMTGRVGFDGELEAYPQQQLLRWVSFQVADGSHWLASAHGYQLLVGGTADQPALVKRLALLSGASVLAHDSRGIAVVNPSPGPSAGCAGDGSHGTAAELALRTRASEGTHG